jgi:hypothetical protein
MNNLTIQLELNLNLKKKLEYNEWNLISNPIRFNNWIKIRLNKIQIELKTNGMQIGGKNIKNLLGNIVLIF